MDDNANKLISDTFILLQPKKSIKWLSSACCHVKIGLKFEWFRSTCVKAFHIVEKVFKVY